MAGKQNRQWIAVDVIVNQYIDESEQSSNKFFKLFQIAFRGMEEMGLDSFYAVKSVRIPVNGNKTVTLPADYLNYTKVGRLNGDGTVSTMKYNESLATHGSLTLDRLKEIGLDDYSVNSSNYYNYWDGDGYGVVCGSDYNYNGEGFKIDNANGIIVLGAGSSLSEILLEYISTPKEDGQYFVPVQFREALIEWIGWRDIKSLPASSRFNLGDKRDRKADYYNQRRLAIAKYKPFRIEDVTPKRLEVATAINNPLANYTLPTVVNRPSPSLHNGFDYTFGGTITFPAESHAGFDYAIDDTFTL